VSGEEVYVVALVGKSPGVVTELLWYLAKQEGRKIAGVELWTTYGAWSPGTPGLADDGPAMYAKLAAKGGGLPQWPSSLQPVEDPELAPTGQVQVYIPGGPSLPDVTNEREARLFGEALHRRIAYLRREIPSRLVGSLAGGRKTMTASMQSAFGLYARGSDRLCHVLVNRTVENKLGQKALSAFAFPTRTIGGVAPKDQLSVVDVPFFSAADYLAAVERRTAQQLVTDAREQLEGLRAASTGRLELRRVGRYGVVTFGVDQTVQCAPKTVLAYGILLGCGSLLATELAEQTEQSIREWLGPSATLTREHEFGEDPGHTWRNLRAELIRVAGSDPLLSTLVPSFQALKTRGRRDSRWEAIPDASIDWSALDPIRALPVLFPRESKTRRRRPR
jgi:CRISPR-associated protein (TIGR02584 family)